MAWSTRSGPGGGWCGVLGVNVTVTGRWVVWSGRYSDQEVGGVEY